ncbi:CorA family divalent cation transporter [Deinococcus hopiensis]|uniref:Mg2+ and Co2+ transporter CorA n=1 Tax=Deinococcus hopiensis KR-140 TaxID=695939 RepID=A0A1W1VA52_9DEIO|nr:CorA family divalent cation transporter [Deinococcus hopiensis]SMB90232.1 Mg2+ and Co2+ transporter CorA [Deinococcus hopiensis KR-140]
MNRTYLFDADGDDHEVTLSAEQVRGLREDQLLWVDLSRGDAGETQQLAALLDLPPRLLERQLNDSPHPQVVSDGGAFRVDVQSVRVDEGGRLTGMGVSVFVAPNVLVTVHQDGIDFLKEFAAQQRSNGKVGRLSSGLFLAALLGWHLTSYLREVERLEERVDRLDEAILRSAPERDFLEDLAAQRRHMGELRRLLTSHRGVYATLSRPDFKALADGETAAAFDALEQRFERAVMSVEGLRDVILGSFDLYMSSLGRRTNDIVRLLTVVTVLTGVGSLIAGLFGMNFELTFEKSGWRGFALVVGALLLLFVAVLWAARRRRWV